jgi:hypothetical protein
VGIGGSATAMDQQHSDSIPGHRRFDKLWPSVLVLARQVLPFLTAEILLATYKFVQNRV